MIALSITKGRGREGQVCSEPAMTGADPAPPEQTSSLRMRAYFENYEELAFAAQGKSTASLPGGASRKKKRP
jgi:hypothetical protein